jgi:hypothetical protein
MRGNSATTGNVKSGGEYNQGMFIGEKKVGVSEDWALNKSKCSGLE